MQRTQVYLSKTQLNTLRREAQKQNQTVSDLLRTCIDQKLVQQKKPNRMKYETLQQAGKRISRLTTQGPKDLAQQVDTYLYESK